LIIGGVVTAIIFFFTLNLFDFSNLYSNQTLQHLEKRKRQTVEWQEDRSIWKRFGMIWKTRMILKEHFWLGVGFSNRSFSKFDGGEQVIMGHIAKVGRFDAHNTFLNILSGTGILGFLAFLYYLSKVFIVFRKIPKNVWKNTIFGSFLVSVIGGFLNSFVLTMGFENILLITGIIISIYIFNHNLEDSDQLLQENSV